VKRVVSLVPSWTETLIAAGVNVVGRTRFCIHPSEQVANIPIVGGTKSFDIEKIRALNPDLILLDREENTFEMSELAKVIAPLHVSHVESVREMPRELEVLAQVLEGETATSLLAMKDRYVSVLRRPTRVLHKGLFVYCIWKEPWMAIGQNTFIASMLEQTGYDLGELWPITSEKYPKFEIADLPAEIAVLLSSEPYPFAKQFEQLHASFQGRDVKLVDGESFSWFGIRALRYLESVSNSR
jgi:ABC-type Fe3+-hydroxamate transport system substrate-binding protein